MVSHSCILKSSNSIHFFSKKLITLLFAVPAKFLSVEFVIVVISVTDPIMAEETQNKYETPQSSEVEVQDRGVFDFLGKKKEEEKPQEEVIVTEFEKVTVSEEEKKEEEVEKKHSLLEKLHRSDSSSSSVSLSSHFHAKICIYFCVCVCM